MKQLDIDVPAPVSYVHSLRARQMRITIKPDPAVIVTVPRRGNLQDAREFLASKLNWVKRHLETMTRQRQKAVPPVDLQKIDLAKAQDELFRRLAHFSQLHNLPYQRAAFRCQKTKWGSCSAQNAISLNINIIFLPEHLQDYILLHELVHVRHKNHGVKFWAELDRYCDGRAKVMRKELRVNTFQIKQ